MALCAELFRRIDQLEKTIVDLKSSGPPLFQWTGSKAALTELLYAMLAAGVLNYGTIGIKEAAQNFAIQIAFAFEVAVKSAVRQARTGHDLRDRDVIESVPVEQPAGALNNFPFDLLAVTSGIRHIFSLRVLP